jgi:hypothetical protein
MQPHATWPPVGGRQPDGLASHPLHLSKEPLPSLEHELEQGGEAAAEQALEQEAQQQLQEVLKKVGCRWLGRGWLGRGWLVPPACLARL